MNHTRFESIHKSKLHAFIDGVLTGALTTWMIMKIKNS